MKKLVTRLYKWCWNTERNLFPPIRILFLTSTTLFFFGDIGIDIFTAYEHYKAWREGSDSALDYFIATVFFILFPSFLINVISLALYVWGQCMFHNKRYRRSYELVKATCTGPDGSERQYYHTFLKQKHSLVKYENNLREAIWKRLPQIIKRNRSLEIATDEDRTIPLVRIVPLTTRDEDTVIVNKHVVESSEDPVDHPSCVHDENEDHVESSNDSSEIREEERPGSILLTPPPLEEGIEDTDTAPEFYPIDRFTSSQFILIVVLHIFQLGFVIRVLILLYKRREDEKSFDRYRDLSFLRLMEGFFEAAPQLLLQLYIITLEDIPDVARKSVTGIAVIVSMASLALAIADYISAGKDILHYNPPVNVQKKLRLSWLGYFLVILWHLAMTISRGISISLFATEYYSYVFVMGLAHYLLMVYWLYGESGTVIFKPDKTLEHQKSILFGHYGFELLAAVFNIFFPFRLRNDDSLSFITSYYTVFFFENLLLISLWVVHVDHSQDLWYLEAAPITVVATFFVGVLFMILYYAKCQPKEDKSEDTDGPSDRRHFAPPIPITCSMNRMYLRK